MDGCRHCTPCALERIESALSRLEIGMATAKEQIDQLSTKVDGLSSVTADVAQDFQAFKAAMEAERENLTPDGQAALDAANAKIEAARAQLADLDVAVGDADGSDAPAEEPESPSGDIGGGPGAGDDPEDTEEPAGGETGGEDGNGGGEPVDDAGLGGTTPGTEPNPETGQQDQDEAPPAGEGTVVSPDAPVDGDVRPTA